MITAASRLAARLYTGSERLMLLEISRLDHHTLAKWDKDEMQAPQVVRPGSAVNETRLHHLSGWYHGERHGIANDPRFDRRLGT